MDINVRPRHRVLRSLIESQGYAPLARKLGTSPGYLHDLAHGRRKGSIETLTRIAAELDLELEDVADVEPAEAVA